VRGGVDWGTLVWEISCAWIRVVVGTVGEAGERLCSAEGAVASRRGVGFIWTSCRRGHRSGGGARARRRDTC
jgi:hypothetical protein